jgi:exosortase family protein XrtM
VYYITRHYIAILEYSNMTDHPIPGKDYWPDNFNEQAINHTKKMSVFAQVFIFMLCFAVLQFGWQMLRDDDFGHFIRGAATVKPATQIIHLITPQIDAIANGNQIKASGGGIVVKIGCEGLEAMFILIAAFIVAPLKLTPKLLGIIVGTLLIYIANQVRIVSLFYAFRADKPLFYLLHGTVTPIILVAISCMFFYYWLAHYQQATEPKSA